MTETSGGGQQPERPEEPGPSDEPGQPSDVDQPDSRREGVTERRRPIRFSRLIMAAALIGLVGGVVAAGYYLVLMALLDVIWGPFRESLYAMLPDPLAGTSPVWIITGIGGILVGLCIRWLGSPGEISAVVDNIHLRRNRIDPRQTPAMSLTSLVSIAFGGSAGPEAPLVQIVGSMGSALGDRLRLFDAYVRTFSFCGMAAALGAFFGAPLGGALFALEIPHRRGLEYYEALIPALVSSGLSFVMFRLVTGVEGVLYSFPAMPDPSLLAVGQGILAGVVGAAVGAAFIGLFHLVGRAVARWEKRVVLLAAAGGVAIGLIEGLVPEGIGITTLFWSEYQIPAILSTTPAELGPGLVAAGLLLVVATLKALAISATLHSGFRGGFVFPLFFLGAATGLAFSIAAGGLVPAPVAMICGMAAVNVAVTKTPVSTTIILATLSGTATLPVVGAASMTAFLLTTPVTLISTQRSRPDRGWRGRFGSSD